MSRTVRLAAAARADIIDILEHSGEVFGIAARQRYERLISAALRDIADAPERPGSSARPDLGDELRSWHLRRSRERARDAGGVVHRPRHVIFYTIIDENSVGIMRVLHDAMEVHRHVERQAFPPDDD